MPKFEAFDLRRGDDGVGMRNALGVSRKQKYRSQCHKLFDKLWSNKSGMTRVQAYQWLAKAMGITLEECHFSTFSMHQLIQAKLIVSRKLANKKKRRSLTLRRRASLCNLGTEEYKEEINNYEN